MPVPVSKAAHPFFGYPSPTYWLLVYLTASIQPDYFGVWGAKWWNCLEWRLSLPSILLLVPLVSFTFPMTFHSTEFSTSSTSVFHLTRDFPFHPFFLLVLRLSFTFPMTFPSTDSSTSSTSVFHLSHDFPFHRYFYQFYECLSPFPWLSLPPTLLLVLLVSFTFPTTFYSTDTSTSSTSVFHLSHDFPFHRHFY
jgi:hypothetical protein